MTLSNTTPESTDGKGPDTHADGAVGDTPHRLRMAAARLLAQHTWPEITLRDITTAAGANVASVGYHFGSKNALLAEVLHDAVTGVTRRQADLLDAMDPDEPLETVVELWLGLAFEAQEVDACGVPVAGDAGISWDIVRRHLGASTPEVAQALAAAGAIVEESLTPRLRHLLPHLNDDELRLRHVGVLAAAAALTGRHPAHESLGLSPPTAEEIEPLKRAVIAFACGALRAPASTIRASATDNEADGFA